MVFHMFVNTNLNKNFRSFADMQRRNSKLTITRVHACAENFERRLS